MATQQIFRTIREQVVDRLRDDVINQVFKPGESLREYTLSERYGVSRSPIRDALLQLTQEGLLVATPNCGAKVGSPLDDEIQPLVLDLRIRIEVFALEQAVKSIEEKDIQELESRLKDIFDACQSKQLSDIIKSDMAFHQAIVELANNEKLVGIWKQVSGYMMLHYERHEDWMESYGEHAAIFEAIKLGDKRAARDALKANIR
ncbi:MAG: GntR family transcriptional regulator [Verrucomicrobiae bacterium]|nr:GntR family transcriptional regulator [Verrucomicrobiae bacterium]